MNRTRIAMLGFAAAAAVAALGLLLGRAPAERTPERTPVVRVVAAPVEELLSVVPPSTSARTSPELPSGGFQAGPDAKAPSAPALAGESEDTSPGARVDEATIARLYGDRPLTADHPHVRTAVEVQERNTDWLLAHPAVVGTAVGLNDQAEISLLVLTKVAGVADLPAVIAGVPVVIWQTGELNARNRMPAQDATKLAVVGSTDLTDRLRPAPIGASTGHQDITAGTIGCRVKSGANVFALSNNHVYANENLAAIGDNALQPGAYDGGIDPDDAIGTLHDFQPIVFTTSASNTIDAAIAASSTANLGRATPSGGYGTPKTATASASLNLKVKKVGRTTGQTTGRVWGINGTVNVGYGAGVARFVGQIIITPGSFSAGGDSGSLIVTNNKTSSQDRKPVGLLFAGSSSSTIANPIGAVLTRFGVTVDGE